METSQTRPCPSDRPKPACPAGPLRPVWWAVLALLLGASMVAGLLFGQTDIFPLTDTTRNILWNLRLPRVLFGAVNGGALALSGVLYQIALRNPLADGFTTGAASSAAFGGCFALVLAGSGIGVSLAALVTAFTGIGLVRHIVARAGDQSRITIILAGIGLSVVAGSGISFLKYFFEDSVSTMVFWLMGGLYAATYSKTAILFLTLGLVCLYLWLRRRHLALLFLDDASAQTSGVDVHKLREILFAVTTTLVALSVSFCGVIGFLGLLVPHASRAILGHGLMAQLVGSTLLGASALVLFDLCARTVLPYGGELPVGIITSFAGGLFFFILLIRKGHGVWAR